MRQVSHIARCVRVVVGMSVAFCGFSCASLAQDELDHPSALAQEALMRLAFYTDDAPCPMRPCTSSVGFLRLTTFVADDDAGRQVPRTVTSAAALDALLGGAINRAQGIAFPYKIPVGGFKLRHQMRIGYSEDPSDPQPVLETEVVCLERSGLWWTMGLRIAIGVAQLSESMPPRSADLIAHGELRLSVSSSTAVAVEERSVCERTKRKLAGPVAGLCLERFRRNHAHVHRNVYFGLTVGAPEDWADISPSGMPGGQIFPPLFTWRGGL